MVVVSIVPYQLSVPTTFQPAAVAVEAVRPARPLVRVLLKISTRVLPRLIGSALGEAFGVAVAVGSAVGEELADGLLTVGVAAWFGSSGSGRP